MFKSHKYKYLLLVLSMIVLGINNFTIAKNIDYETDIKNDHLSHYNADTRWLCHNARGRGQRLWVDSTQLALWLTNFVPSTGLHKARRKLGLFLL